MDPTISSSEQKISFPGQYPDEKIILVKRRHPVILLGMALYIVLMILLPFLSYVILISLVEISLSVSAIQLLVFLSGLYFLFFTAIAFHIVIDYYLDVWIITDQRIMSVEQRGLFNRKVNELRYERIQDITSDVSGLMPTYFQFGNISIQTAAENERMILKQVPDPIETRRIIAETYKNATERAENQTGIQAL